MESLYIIISIIAGGIGAFIGSYFKQKGENLANKNDIALLTEKVESVKSEFSIFVNAHSKLYEIRIEIYKELYISLLELASSVQKWLVRIDPPNVSKEQVEQELDKEISEKFQNFARTFINHSIFLPDKIELLFKTLMDEYRAAIEDHGLYTYLKNLDVGKEYTKDGYDARIKVLHKISKDFPQLINELRREIKSIIENIK